MAKIANSAPFWTCLRDLPDLLINDRWSLLPGATLLIPEAGHRPLADPDCLRITESGVESQSLRIEHSSALMLSFVRRETGANREAFAESRAVAGTTHQRQRLFEIT